jgi:TatD DNase family protein
MELCDTHCHLSFPPLVNDLDGVMSRARERGVTRIVVPAYDLESWDDIDEIAQREGVFPAFGLHPWVADQPLDPDELSTRLRRARAVAVGEIGLDTKIDTVPLAVQLETLEIQLEVAAAMKLPVLLHCRGAFEELLDAVSRHEGLRGVVHAFSRGPELAARFIEAGLYLAFGGAVTRPRAKRPRRSATEVPRERMLLETDAPSIGLDGIEPSEVEPCHVHDIAEAVARSRGTTLAAVAEETTSNARALFDLG